VTSHVDPETLALFAEGELNDKAKEEQVRAWLAESEEARAQLSALREVSQILASAPVPPMPEGLVDRIDEALRAEAKKHAARSRPAVAPEASIDEIAKVRPLPRPRGPARWMPFLVAASAAVFVLGAGAAAVSGLFTADPPADPGTAAEPPPASSPHAALPYRISVVSSGTDYTADNLATQGASVLERASLTTGEGEESLSLEPDSAVPADVASCAHTLSDTYGAPALVDLASYEGQPAWIMFFPAALDSETDGYTVRVVEPGCAEEDDPTSAVRDTASLPNH
jgi:hypothetical protein